MATVAPLLVRRPVGALSRRRRGAAGGVEDHRANPKETRVALLIALAGITIGMTAHAWIWRAAWRREERQR